MQGQADGEETGQAHRNLLRLYVDAARAGMRTLSRRIAAGCINERHRHLHILLKVHSVGRAIAGVDQRSDTDVYVLVSWLTSIEWPLSR